jgi:hypothetical protein
MVLLSNLVMAGRSVSIGEFAGHVARCPRFHCAFDGMRICGGWKINRRIGPRKLAEL